ncbi:hypothetical protein BDV93DRAFT_472075 [Ceratobasidium sp. AG-I]|nr:hypothetical protein BDV93DRAFT_472075 [Ceratobasidium sp. AG-I]
MIIPIHLPASQTQNPYPPLARLGNALFLIEIQGRLEVTGERDGGFVGTLVVGDKDKVTLRIGVNHLEGKIASLPKPLGILTKRRIPGSDPAHTQTEYEITEIVSKKIIFSKRPTPIVGHAGSSINYNTPAN